MTHQITDRVRAQPWKPIKGNLKTGIDQLNLLTKNADAEDVLEATQAYLAI